GLSQFQRAQRSPSCGKTATYRRLACRHGTYH
ncbi:hypothetical protein D021_3033B, partial [Vibrio parahaemolyticus 10296]